MNPQLFVAICARIAAIWLAIDATESLVDAWNQASNMLEESQRLLVYLGPAARLTGALVLWLFPLYVAHKLLPARDDDEPFTVDARAVASAGSAIVGALAILDAIPGVMTLIGAQLFGYESYVFDSMAFNRAGLLRCLAQALFGLILIFKAGAIAARVVATGRLDQNR